MKQSGAPGKAAPLITIHWKATGAANQRSYGNRSTLVVVLER